MSDIFGEKITLTVSLLSKYWSFNFPFDQLTDLTTDGCSSEEKFVHPIYQERYWKYISLQHFSTLDSDCIKCQNIKNVKKY